MNEDKINAEGLNAEEPSEEELKYNDCMRLYNSMSCMTTTQEKVKVYKKLAKDFKSLGKYNDAEELSKRCEECAKDTQEKTNEAKLSDARELIDTAKTADDLKKAEKLLKELNDYKDVEELEVSCKNAYKKLTKKRKYGVFAFYFIIVCIVGLLIAAQTHFFKFQFARVVGKVGMKPWAISIMEDLDGYKNSNNWVKKYSYSLGKDIMSGKNLKLDDYNKAKEAFDKSKGYKDSNKMLAEILQQRISAKAVGKMIELGDNRDKFVIVEKQDDKVLVVKVEGITGLPYAKTKGDVTWETSYLRKYLNSTYMKKLFTKEERKFLIETQIPAEANTVYSTTGGNDTKDKMFILSSKEQKKYTDILKKHRYIKTIDNTWLRTPGAVGNLVSFVNPQDQIMCYGYPGDSKSVSTLPAFWYKIK